MPVIKDVNFKTKAKQYSDGDLKNSSSISNRVLAMYDAIVGSSLQVSQGSATHTSIQSAHDFVSSGGNILVLEGIFTENVIISKTVKIQGQGHNSELNGTLEFASGSNFCAVKLLRVMGNITMDAASNGNFLTECWLASGQTLSDLGSGNYKTVIGE